MNKQRPMRGEIWLIDLDPILGHEQGRQRPCVVISVNEFNLGNAELHIILPITTKYRDLPTFVEINHDSGLKYKSFVICDQIRTVSISRFEKRKLGKINNSVFQKIQNRLMFLLGFK